MLQNSSLAYSFFLQDDLPLCALPRQATPPSATSSHLYQVRPRIRLVLYMRDLLDSCFTVYVCAHVFVSDQQGGFELQAAEDVERQNRLLEQLQRLRTSLAQDKTEEPTRVSFTPLLDIPVDSCSHPESFKPPRSSPKIPNWLLTQDLHSPPTTPGELTPDPEKATLRRGRSPFRNGHSESKANKKEKAGQDVFFTVVNTPRHRRPLLSQVFAPLRRTQSSAVPSVGQGEETQAHERHCDQEYKLQTVCISKTKRSLGEEIAAVCSVRNKPLQDTVLV